MSALILDTTSFWDVVWWMIGFFFLTMLIWMFIAVFGDIFRRRDHSGWAKAGWTLVIFALPFLGVLIYMAARPAVTEADGQAVGQMYGHYPAATQSAAVEIDKANQLLATGAINQAEFDELKRRALA